MKFAVVVDNKIVNIALWDGVSEWSPEGEIIDMSELPAGCSIGWELVNNVWVDPQPEVDELKEEEDAVE